MDIAKDTMDAIMELIKKKYDLEEGRLFMVENEGDVFYIFGNKLYSLHDNLSDEHKIIGTLATQPYPIFKGELLDIKKHGSRRLTFYDIQNNSEEITENNN